MHGLRRHTKYYPGLLFETPCHRLAQKFPEPFTAEYWPRGRVNTSGPAWSFYQHQGSIHQDELLAAERATNHPLLRIKILDGKLYYRKPGLFQKWPRVFEVRRVDVLSGILTALALFDIPDLDLAYDPDDFLQLGGPLFQNCGNNATGEMLDGFTIPFPDAIIWSLGPEQMEVMRMCLDRKYPPEGRIPKVVWRGRSRPVQDRTVDGGQFGPREKAIIAGQELQELADIGATSFNVS